MTEPHEPLDDPAANTPELDDLSQAIITEGPFTLEERAAFLKSRYTFLLERLVPHGKPLDDLTRGRLRAKADELAFEDLQAVLGRRGPLAAKVELELWNQLLHRDGQEG